MEFIITLAVLLYIFTYSLKVYSQQVSDDSMSMLQTVIKETATNTDDLVETDDSNITTKIYKSTDKFSKFLDEQFNSETTSDVDVLTKDELIRQGNGKSKKDKYLKRLIKKDEVKRNSNNNFFLPWLALLSLVAILSVIFNILKKNKI